MTTERTYLVDSDVLVTAKRIMGYKDLWMLKAHLDELDTPPVDAKEVAA